MLKNLIVKQVKKHLDYDQEEQRILKENYQKELNENNVDVKLTALAIGGFREVVTDFQDGWDGVGDYVDVFQRVFITDSFIPQRVAPDLSDIAVQGYENWNFYTDLYAGMSLAKSKNQGVQEKPAEVNSGSTIPDSDSFEIQAAFTFGKLAERYLPSELQENIENVFSSFSNIHDAILAASLGYYLKAPEELMGEYYSKEVEEVMTDRYMDLTVSFDEYIHDSMQEMTF